MIRALNRFWRHGYAKGTRRSYARQMHRYQDWCRRHGIEGDGLRAQPTEQDLMVFVTSESRRGLSPGAIKSSLAAIAAGCLANGFKNPCRDAFGCPWPILRHVVRGISRMTSKARKTRKPLTVDKLRAVLKFATTVTGSGYDSACMKAALSMGVYLLLRVGELVSPKTSGHNKMKGLCVNDVEFLPSFAQPDRMVVHIRNSKNDPFRNGAHLTVWANGSSTCPVKLTKQWLQIRGRTDGDGALFKLNSGKLLTRATLQKWMRAALTLAGYEGEEHSCHSLRAGGAESLAAAGFDGSMIQVMGRWASDAFLLYLKLGDQIRKEASVEMSKLRRQDIDTMVRRGRDKDSAEWI